MKKPFIINLQLFGEGNTIEENDTIDLVSLQNTILEMKKKQDELEQKNAKLLQHNTELYLKATKEVEETKTEDNTNEYEEFVGKEFYNTLSKKEKNMLKDILEGED